MLVACEAHEDIKETIRDHEKRITQLETQTAATFERIDALCKRLDELSERLDRFIENCNSWSWRIMFGCLALLAGFFVWYVQSLAR